MASLGNTFDATTVDPTSQYDVIPPGKYVVQVIDSDIKLTKAGDTSYLWLELEIIEGELAGRKVWDRLNINSANETARDIAQRSLSSLCHASGKLAVADSTDLHFITVVADIRVSKPTEKYPDPQNQIRGYSAKDGSKPVVNAASKQTAVSSAPAASAAANRPWNRARASA